MWGTPAVARDVIYAGDFAAAVLLLLTRSEIKYDIFNLGFGEVVTVREVVDLALKYGRHDPVEISYSENSPSTIRVRAIDCQKIKKTLNWEPATPIEEGIKRTSQWWVENKDRWSK